MAADNILMPAMAYRRLYAAALPPALMIQSRDAGNSQRHIDASLPLTSATPRVVLRHGATPDAADTPMMPCRRRAPHYAAVIYRHAPGRRYKADAPARCRYHAPIARLLMAATPNIAAVTAATTATATPR